MSNLCCIPLGRRSSSRMLSMKILLQVILKALRKNRCKGSDIKKELELLDLGAEPFEIEIFQESENVSKLRFKSAKDRLELTLNLTEIKEDCNNFAENTKTSEDIQESKHENITIPVQKCQCSIKMEQCDQTENSNSSDTVNSKIEIAKETTIEHSSTETHYTKHPLSLATLTYIPLNTTTDDVYEEVKFVPTIPPPDSFTDLPQLRSYENLKRRSTNFEQERISGLVHELIMEKYEPNLSDIKQRSFEVHTSLKKKIEKVNMRYSDRESMDSGLSQSDEEKDEPVTTDEKEKSTEVEYDEHAFLVEALGEEIANMEDSVNSLRGDHYYSSVPAESTHRLTCNTERSVGSSNISTLLSSTGTGHRSEAVYSLYSTVKKSPKSKRRENGKKVSINNDIDYESIDEYKLKSKEDEIMGEIVVQWETMQQVSKALKEFKNRPHLFGKGIQIEAEKILLISSIKRDILKEELKKITTEKNPQTSVSIKVTNLRFFLKPKIELKKNNWYFVCIVQSRECVRGSSIMQEEKGEIVFKDSFDFEETPTNLEMNISLYGLQLKNMKAKTTCLTWTRGTKDHNNITGQTSFKLLGETSIKSLHPVQYIFKLVKIPKESPILDSFTADIRCNFEINIKESGFLTLGTNYKGTPIWNRRWCILNGTKLQYWNYPNEDAVSPPIGEIDLTNCVTTRIKSVHRDVCARPRTLLLEVEVDPVNTTTKKYFLCTDSISDLEEWQRQLNAVLNALNKWKDF